MLILILWVLDVIKLRAKSIFNPQNLYYAIYTKNHGHNLSFFKLRKKKTTRRLVNFAIPVDHKRKIKEKKGDINTSALLEN